MNAIEFKKAIKILSNAACKNAKRNIGYNRIFLSNTEIYAIIDDKFSEHWTRVSFPVSLPVSESFYVDAKQFAAAVTALNDPEIVLSIRDKSLFINERIKLICEEHEGRQNIKPTEDAKNISVPSSFGKDLRDIIPFVSQDLIRPVMCGVFFDGSQADTIVASDGHMLISRVLGSGSSGINFVIPVCFAAVCPNVEQIKYWTDKDTAYIYTEADGVIYVSSCEDNNNTSACFRRYPNWRSVMPKNRENKKIFSKKDVLNLLTMAKKMKLNNIILCFLGSILKLVCYDEKLNTSELNLNCEYCGPDLNNISFRTEYLFKILKAFSKDTVVLSFVSDERPAIIEDDNTELLIMPIIPNAKILEETKSKTQLEYNNNPASSPGAVTSESNPVSSPGAVTSESNPVSSPGAVTGESNPVSSPGAVTGESNPASSPGAVTSESNPVSSPGAVTSESNPVSSPGAVTSESNPVSSPGATTPAHNPVIDILYIEPMEFRKHHRFFETVFKIFIFAALRKRSEFERFLPVLLFLVYIVFRTAAPSRAPRRLFRPPVLAPEPGGTPDILYIEPMEFRKHHRFLRARFKKSNFRFRRKISDKRGFISVFGDKFPFSVDKSPCVYDFTPEKPP